MQVITTDFVKEIGTEYKDAQYYSIPVDMTIQEFQSQNEEAINAEKDKRIANWVEAIKNPPQQAEPTKEELQAEHDALIEQKSHIDARVAEIMELVKDKGK